MLKFSILWSVPFLAASAWVSHLGGEHGGVPRYTLVYPSSRLVKSEGVSNVILEIDPVSVVSVTFYIPWDSTLVLSLPSKTKRRSVVEQFVDSLPAELILESMRVVIHPWHMQADTGADDFAFIERISARAFLSSDTTHRSMRVYYDPRDALTAQIRISGWLPVTVPAGERDRYCTGNIIGMPVRLHPGVNRIPFEVHGAPGVALIVDTVSIDYALELADGRPPEGFAVQRFHTGDAQGACARCHAKGSPPAKAAWECGSCHAAMLSMKSVHAPAGTGECATCHEEAPGFKPKYSPDGESETCYTCHEAIGSDVKNKAPHPALLDGHCGKCHSPHGSPFASQMRTRTNDICYPCHAEKSEGNHPVVFHPVTDRMDPRGEAKEFSCASCHNPHASEHPKLSRFGGGYFAGCMACHNK